MKVYEVQRFHLIYGCIKGANAIRQSNWTMYFQHEGISLISDFCFARKICCWSTFKDRLLFINSLVWPFPWTPHLNITVIPIWLRNEIKTVRLITYLSHSRVIAVFPSGDFYHIYRFTRKSMSAEISSEWVLVSSVLNRWTELRSCSMALLRQRIAHICSW